MNKVRTARLKKRRLYFKIGAAIALVIFIIGLVGTCIGIPARAAEPVEVIAARDRTSKTYYLGDGQYSLDVSLASKHYKDEYGDWQNIETNILPSDKPSWTYEVEKGHYQILINDDTSVAVGKGGNWIGFKYVAFGYLDWTTKDYHILQTRQSVTPVVAGNTITWPDIFYGADLEYIYMPDGFKENLYISQETRIYLQANPPSAFGLDNNTSYLVGIIECDWQLQTFTPETADGTPINWDNINEFIDSGVNWRDPVLDKIITALPIGVAYHEDGAPDDYVNLRYRFYKSGDTNYLLFGARVLDLNALPIGTIVIDPTIDEQVGASLDDAHEYESSGAMSPTLTTLKIVAGTSATNRYWGGFRWTSASFPSAADTIDVCYIEIYISSTLWDDMRAYWHFQDGTAAPDQFSTDDYDITDRTRTDDSTYWNDDSMGIGWAQSPSLVDTLQELIDNYSPTAIVAIARPSTALFKEATSKTYDSGSSYGAKLHIEYTSGGASAPTVITSAATLVEDTTARLNGEVTDTGGENPTVTVYWGDNDGGEVAENWDYSSAPTSPSQPQGAATFYKDVTGLATGTTHYFNAKAVNSGGTDWATTQSFLTKPAAPTNIAATDGDHTDKVVITWTKSVGATGYKIYRDDELIDTVGDVATYDDTGADAPTITAGSTVATDGTYTDKVALSLSGTSANVGTTHTYKLKATNGSGDSDDSGTDTGYRGVGSLTYQWQRSSGDADSDYSNISGATGSTYDDTAAPAPTITAGSSVATDGDHTDKVALSLSGTSTSNGAGRYYQCVLNAAGAAEQTSASNRGYRGVGSLTYQWQRSIADSDGDYLDITGATSSTYDDTGAPAPTITGGSSVATDGDHTDKVALSLSGTSANVGTGRYYRCKLNAAGASQQYSASNRGYRGVGSLTYQWQRSSGDADSDYSNITGATSSTYDDTGSPVPTITGGNATASDGTSGEYVTLDLENEAGNNGAGRYYKCLLSALGASNQTSTSDRGYRGASALSYQWYRSFTDAASNYSAIAGATTVPYNDTGGVIDPDGRYYLCTLNMTDAVAQNSTADRGYMTALGAPNVTSHAATSITGVSALLRGEVLDTGGATITLRGFEWGTESGNYTYSWNGTGSFGAGIFTRTITSLQINTTYYWRAYATNVVSTNYSAERSFTTLAVPAAPTDFTITQVGIESITISWTMGAGADIVVIICNESGYPDDISDGYIVYSGNETSVTLSGLWFDTTMYYYRAWSYNDYGYSPDYAEGSVGTAISVGAILFVIALTVAAFWKRGYIRLLLSVCIIIWAIFMAEYDLIVGMPFLAVALYLFLSDIISLWRGFKGRRRLITEPQIITKENQDEVIY